jgi:hypothetical protein
MPDPVFVVVRSTGGIGSIAVRAVAENRGLELVGVWGAVDLPLTLPRNALRS